MRYTNAARLQSAIRAKGEFGLELTIVGARVSRTLLERLMNGTYGRIPKPRTRDRLCVFLKVTEDELFPLAPTGGESKAS